MRHVLPAVLLLLALIHALPLAGVLGAGKLASLYGIAIPDASTELLMRHRAVLFGLLAAFLAYAAFHRPLQGLALVAAAVSVGAFLLLAAMAGGPVSQPVAVVVKVDLLALVLVAVGALAPRP